MDENDEVLLDMLAFLDACDSPSESGPSRDAPLSGSAGSPWTEHSEQRKRAHRLAVKSRYRGRVKEEYSSLRGDVRALEAVLTQLKGSHKCSKTVLGRVSDSPVPAQRSAKLSADQAYYKSSIVTREVATNEYKRRKESEALNRELRALLFKARKATSTTKAAWDKLLATKGIQVLGGEPADHDAFCQNAFMLYEPHPQPTQHLPRQSVGHRESRGTLSLRLDRLALSTDWHFERAGLTNSNSFTYRTERMVDPRFDSSFEIVMSSSLPCSKEQAASLMLKFLCDGDRHGFTQVDNLETFKETVKSVRFGNLQHNMEGLCSKRIIVEADRIRILWSTISFLPTAATNIREDSILALQCTTSGSTPACLLQIWYRVAAEPFAPRDTKLQVDSQNELLTESVLRSHCRTTGEFFQSVEKMLANEVFNTHT